MTSYTDEQVLEVLDWWIKEHASPSYLPHHNALLSARTFIAEAFADRTRLQAEVEALRGFLSQAMDEFEYLRAQLAYAPTERARWDALLNIGKEAIDATGAAIGESHE